MTFGDIGEGPSPVRCRHIHPRRARRPTASPAGTAQRHALGDGRPPLLGQPSVSRSCDLRRRLGPALYAAPAFPGPDRAVGRGAMAGLRRVRRNGLHDGGARRRSGEPLYVGGDFAVIGDTEVSGIASAVAPLLPRRRDLRWYGRSPPTSTSCSRTSAGQTTTGRDTDGDGVVNLVDLNAVLANFGSASLTRSLRVTGLIFSHISPDTAAPSPLDRTWDDAPARPPR